MASAVAVASKPSFRDKFRYFNRTLVLTVCLIAVSTFNYGFDNQAFATTQSMDAFTVKFGVLNPATKQYELEPYWLSLFNSLNYIGFAAGVLLGGTVSARFGRRWCMFAMSCYALVSATICMTAQSREQIMAGRILNYIYVGMELSVVPVFQSEIVPAPARGLVVGTYQVSLYAGGLVINAVCYATGGLTDDRAYRIPFGLFYVVPTIVLSLIWFVPESPRWLIRQGRYEEGRAMLQRLRSGPFSDAEIETEFNELRTAVERQEEKGRFVELWQGINLRRTLINLFTNFFQQATGQAFTSQYGAVYVRSLGVMKPTHFAFMSSGISMAVGIFTLLAADWTGRRPQLMLSSFVMMSGLITMGGLGISNPVPVPQQKGVLACMVIFATGFALGWGPLTYVVATEVVSLQLRDQASRLGFFVNVLFNFLVNFSIPYLINAKYAGLNSKVGFIFGAIAVLSFMFVWFCVPECKGKTLEEIDALFENGTRYRDFGKVDARQLMAARATSGPGTKSAQGVADGSDGEHVDAEKGVAARVVHTE